MARIEQSSGKISEITSVIDDRAADQPLAPNAAVEAARAGGAAALRSLPRRCSSPSVPRRPPRISAISSPTAPVRCRKVSISSTRQAARSPRSWMRSRTWPPSCRTSRPPAASRRRGSSRSASLAQMDSVTQQNSALVERMRRPPRRSTSRPSSWTSVAFFRFGDGQTHRQGGAGRDRRRDGPPRRTGLSSRGFAGSFERVSGNMRPPALNPRSVRV